MPLVPRAVALVLLADRLGTTEARALALLEGADEPHRIGVRPLAVALPELLTTTGTGVAWAVLPVPGDPGVPPSAAAPALPAGEAAVVRGTRDTVVLVPDVAAFGSALEPGWTVRWRPVALGPGAVVPPPADLGEARLALVHALHDATDELTRLDVARERPELREALLDLSGPADDRTAELLESLPERPAAALLQALRVLRIVELAEEDPGAAVTAGQLGARSAALAALARAARVVVAAATVRRVG